MIECAMTVLFSKIEYQLHSIAQLRRSILPYPSYRLRVYVHVTYSTESSITLRPNAPIHDPSSSSIGSCLPVSQIMIL